MYKESIVSVCIHRLIYVIPLSHGALLLSKNRHDRSTDHRHMQGRGFLGFV